MSRGLMPLKYAARKYKLPADWLDSEARSGILSCLIAGTQIFFDEKVLVHELALKVKRGTVNRRAKLQASGGQAGAR